MRNVIFEVKERKNDFTTVDKVFFAKVPAINSYFKKPTITKSKIKKIGLGNPIGLRVFDIKIHGLETICTSFRWMFEGSENGVRAGKTADY